MGARLAPVIDARSEAVMDKHLSRLAELSDQIAALQKRVADLEQAPRSPKPWKENLYVPHIKIHPKMDGPFMTYLTYSTCSTADFLNPEFERLCGLLGIEPEYHRKFWEWVFILHHGLRTGAIGPGRRALGFAVGSEPLLSAFAAAGAFVTATDAPEEIGVGQGWRKTGQHAAQLLDLHNPQVVDRDVFLERVSFSTCDMNAIPAELNGYDFCWPACSFEHLGSIDKGLDFVLESVEKTLKPGSVACHTTELNLSSDTDTVEEGPTVLYRKSDLLRFVNKMERHGHKVEPLCIAPDTHVLDFYADTPPYSVPPHLRLQLLGYVSTSVGLVITRRN